MRIVKPSASGAPLLGKVDAAQFAEFEHQCVEFFADMARVLRAPPSAGQIYGLLYASPEPLSFSDIVERLAMSKGSASQGLRLLRSIGAATVIDRQHTRREYFEPELGLRKLVHGILRERLEPLVEMGAMRIERLKQLANQRPEAGKFHLQRVKQLETWRSQLRLILPLLQSLLGPQH